MPAVKPRGEGKLREALLTITQAADFLNVSPKTVRRRIDAGELSVFRDGRLVRVHPNDLDRYVAARRSL